MSRKHAQVKWDLKTKAWYLSCVGKNGCEIDGRFVLPKNNRQKMKEKNRIKIADVVVWLLLPMPAE